MRVSQGLGEADQFFQVFRVGGEMLLVAPVVDRLQGLLLQNERAVNDIPDRPPAFPVLPVPLPLAGRALLDAAGPPDLALNNLPRHGHSPLSKPNSLASRNWPSFGKCLRRKPSRESRTFRGRGPMPC